jgi:hypothetical protein
MDKELLERLRKSREEYEKKLAKEVSEGKATVKYFWGDW